MLLDEFTLVRWNSRNKKHYENLGYTYTKRGEEFLIKTTELPNGSEQLVRVQCFKCHSVLSIVYKDYVKRVNVTYCCNKCKNHKEDLTGKTVNGIIIVKQIEEHRGGNTLWKCICHCGTVFIAMRKQIRNELSAIKSCGCLHLTNLTGQRFGKLVVIGEGTRVKNYPHIRRLLCLCDCGVVKEVRHCGLVTGKAKSCGCTKAKKGKDNPRYNHSISDEERLYGRTINLNYYTWRKQVCVKYKNKCYICQAKGSHAHHLASYAKFPELRFELSNGVLLCKACHIEFHSTYGRHKFTPNDFYTFVETKKRQLLAA